MEKTNEKPLKKEEGYKNRAEAKVPHLQGHEQD